MHVLLINGSPHKTGCTYTALTEVADALEAEGVTTSIRWIETKPIRGCQACGSCSEKQLGRCIFDDDIANSIIDEAVQADGLVVGSPVYYAGANGALTCLLDRMFYSASRMLAYKPATAVASARRAGTTNAYDRLTKYFSINNMPIVSSNYWNQVHGSTAEDVANDPEGLQTMRVLGKNMAWLLKCIAAAEEAGITVPEAETKIYTNFVR